MAGATVFELARQAGASITSSCQESGQCRECLVEIDAGEQALSPRTVEEERIRSPYRLACRARVTDPSVTIRCRTLRRSRLRIETSGTVRHARSGDPARPGLGLAIDLGTTTVVLRLLELATGRIVDARAFENPQCVAGSDVMSRIAFDSRDGTGFLRGTLMAFLDREIRELAAAAPAIHEVVVVGNPTMRDLFFGVDVSTLGQRPYRSSTADRESTALEASAEALGFDLAPGARVCSPPLIGGHVGSDAAASLLVADLAGCDRPRALLDIGTNTEVLVAHGGRILAASCPAGPAFEGAGITWGMPAFDGAIAAVRLAADGGFECDVLGDVRASGICGSGLVAAIAAFLESGLMNDNGRLVDGRDAIVLDAATGVSISERDIAELAQAKAAHSAALTIVSRRLGIELDELDSVFVCGAFGSRLDARAAVRIGLIPKLAPDKIQRLGNTAIEGASVLLTTRGENERLATLVRGIEHVELETDSDFFDLFAEGCRFRPLTGS